MADVFLSYSSEDRARVEPLVNALTARGLSVWWDREIQPGLRFEQVIERELVSARCVIVAWSESSLTSSWVYNEASLALEQRKLVPVLLDPVRPPLAFRHLNAAALDRWSGDPDDAQLATVWRRVARLTAHGPSTEEEQARPYGAAPLRKRWPWLLLALLAVAGASWLAKLELAEAPLPAVAILEFQGSPGDESLALAAELTGEVRDLMTRSRLARVVASSFSGAREPGRAGMDLAYLLEGEVSRDGDTLIVDVYLVDAATGLRAWGQQLSGTSEQLLELSFDIAQGALGAMEMDRAAVPPRDPAGESSTSSAEAYALYLEGVAQMNESANEASSARAARAFEQAIAADASFALAHADLCQLHVLAYRRARRVDDFRLAEARCRRALELNDDLPRAHAALGTLFMSAGDPEASLAAFRRALSLQPTDPDMALGVGHGFAMLGRTVDAEQWYARAAAVAPDYWRVHEAFASLHFGLGRYADATSAYERAAALNPEDAVVWGGLSASRTMIADFEGAVTAAEEALRLEPSAQAISNAASARFFAGQLEQAQQLYERALELESENHLLWGNLAEVMAVRGASAEAAAAFTRAAVLARGNLKVNAEDPVTLTRLASYEAYLGDPQQDCANLIGKAKELAPRDPYVEYDAALTFRRLGEEQQAGEHLARARTLGYPDALIDGDPQLQGLGKPGTATAPGS